MRYRPNNLAQPGDGNIDASPKGGKKITQQFQFGRPIRLVWQCAPYWTLLNILTVLLQGLLPLATIYLLKQMIDAVVVATGSPNKDVAVTHVVYWVGLTALVSLSTVFCRILSEYIGQAQSQLVTDTVTDTLHRQSTTIDLEYYQSPDYFDTLHLAQTQAHSRPVSIVNNLIQIGQNGISSAGILFLLYSIHWSIPPLLFLTTIPELLVRLYYSRVGSAYELANSERERKAWYYHWLMTDVENAKEIRLFSLGDIFRRRYADLRRILFRGRLSLTRNRAVADFLAQSCSTAAVFIAVGYSAYLAVNGAITLGTLVMSYQGFLMGIGFFQGILRGIARLYEDNLYLKHYYRFLALESKVTVTEHPASLPDISRENICFDHVAFSYPGQKVEVLKDVTLTIPAGKIVALVGSNGAGKTTLVNLLCRLYDPSRGSITAGSTDIRCFDPTEWRNNISVVFQDYVQYQLTALENIWVGNSQKDATREQVSLAARLSGADQVIKQLPRQYETVLGRLFEHGTDLSIGQWQKIALARAFFRDARLIVLDEPTSALDPVAEAEVFTQFRQLMAQRSALLISHRFSTVQMADYIYVLDDGVILEEGTHDDLLDRNGVYASLYRMQAQYYQNPIASGI